MDLIEQIATYAPTCEQEEHDRRLMLRFMRTCDDYLERTNELAHLTASAWTVNPERTKTLFVYHNIYDSWSWVGGHADGDPDLRAVARRELEEETGVRGARLVREDILSLEALPVAGHMRRGSYVSSHIHFNLTYLFEADEREVLTANAAENQGVRWFTYEEALAASTEPWMVEHVYRKLVRTMGTGEFVPTGHTSPSPLSPDESFDLLVYK